MGEQRLTLDERRRRQAMVTSAIGGVVNPGWAAVGGAMGGEPGNRGRTAIRAGLGSLGGAVVGTLAAGHPGGGRG